MDLESQEHPISYCGITLNLTILASYIIFLLFDMSFCGELQNINIDKHLASEICTGEKEPYNGSRQRKPFYWV